MKTKKLYKVICQIYYLNFTQWSLKSNNLNDKDIKKKGQTHITHKRKIKLPPASHFVSDFTISIFLYYSADIKIENIFFKQNKLRT